MASVRIRRPLIGGAGSLWAGAARWAREVRSRRRAAMEDYEQELYGVEDDFHSQFAAELEVLAELEGRRGHCRGLVPHSSTGVWPTRGFQEGCSEERREGREAATT